jgi:SAM-dependent methyltransferase
MYSAFPRPLLPFVLCPADGGNLMAVPPSAPLRSCRVECDFCGRAYPVVDGILVLEDGSHLDDESRHEMQMRDENTEGYDRAFSSLGPLDDAEKVPTLSALAPLEDAMVLELGCGTGRYTVALSKRAQAVIAVDFSIQSLRTLAERLPDGSPVALVQADVTSMKVPHGAFTRVLSTLVSNLPSARHREAMYHLAALALGDETGRFVFSAHHYGLRERIRRIPKEGSYPDLDVYRRLFNSPEIERELSPHFQRYKGRPIQVLVPFQKMFHLPAYASSRVAERVPVMNLFGTLLLYVADLPNG